MRQDSKDTIRGWRACFMITLYDKTDKNDESEMTIKKWNVKY